MDIPHLLVARAIRGLKKKSARVVTCSWDVLWTELHGARSGKNGETEVLFMLHETKYGIIQYVIILHRRHFYDHFKALLQYKTSKARLHAIVIPNTTLAHKSRGP